MVKDIIISNSQFTCSVCGDGFEQKSALERHMVTSHPPRAPSAADIEKVSSGIQYPKSKNGLREYAKENISKAEVEDIEELLNVFDELLSREYTNMADVEREVRRIK
jgi:Protein of unknown function (DUF2795)